MRSNCCNRLRRNITLSGKTNEKDPCVQTKIDERWLIFFTEETEMLLILSAMIVSQMFNKFIFLFFFFFDFSYVALKLEIICSNVFIFIEK